MLHALKFAREKLRSFKGLALEEDHSDVVQERCWKFQSGITSYPIPGNVPTDSGNWEIQHIPNADALLNQNPAWISDQNQNKKQTNEKQKNVNINDHLRWIIISKGRVDRRYRLIDSAEGR